MLKKFALICVAATAVSTMAHAAPTAPAGGNGSGGGDVVVLPSHGDDQVVLADPWLKAEAPVGRADCATSFTLPKEVVNELGRVTNILSVYGNSDEFSGNKFVPDRILDSKIHYCLVDTLPKRKSCDRRMDYSSLPAGAKVMPAACTEGSYTWVVKDLLKVMSVREQAKLYVHEGLRRTNTPEETIASVTDGLDLLLKQYNQELGGKLVGLTKDQTEQVLEFKKTLAVAGLTDRDPRNLSVSDLDAINDGIVINRGGGIVNKLAQVDSSVYVGTGVLIAGATVIGANSVIVNSQIGSRVKIGKNTRVISSQLAVCSSSSRDLEIGDGDLIERSKFSLTCQPIVDRRDYGPDRMPEELERIYMRSRKPAVVGNKVVVRDSTVTFNYLTFIANLGNGSRILNSQLTNTSLGNGAVAEQSSTLADTEDFMARMSSITAILVEDGAVISNIHINKGTGRSYGRMVIGKNAKVKNIALTNVTMEISLGVQVGGLLFSAATFGMGPVALSFGVGNGGKLVVPEGATINGGGHTLCQRGYHVSYGEALAGNVMRSARDFTASCRPDTK